jgi:hypothetical protein
MTQSLGRAERKLFVFKRLKARLPAMSREELWCAGNNLAENASMPPEWVKKAISRMSHETPVRPGALASAVQMTSEGRGRIAGFVEASWLAITEPSENEKRAEQNDPTLKQWRELFAPLVGKMKLQQSNLEKHQPAPGAPKTPTEVGLHHKGGREGAKFVINEATMSMKGQLCFWMWVFWLEIEKQGSRESVHAWICEMRFVSCSFKLFEKLCQEIGYRPSGAKS